MINRTLQAQNSAKEIYEEGPAIIKEILENKTSEAGKLKEKIKAKIQEFKSNKDYDFWRELIIKPMVERLKKIEQAVFRMKILSGKAKLSKNHISQEQIELAKAYPFSNLIKVNQNGFASCPWHSDSTPSFYTKNNFGHCFSCGWSGDTIAFVRKLNGFSFKQAIEYLT